MRGEGVRQAQHRRELRAEGRRAEDPQRHLGAGAGHRLDRLSRLDRGEEGLQLQHVLGEVVGFHRIDAQRPHGALVGAGRAPEAEVDAAGEEALQRAELLGDHHGRMVRQHDAAGADADAVGCRRHLADDHRRRRAGDAGHVVVLGEPVAVVAEAVGVAGEVDGVAQRVAGRGAFGNGREVEDGEQRHGSIRGQGPVMGPSR